MFKVVAVGTCKGGVGKTAVSVNVATTQASKINPKTGENYKVLFVDVDPQCNASAVLGYPMLDDNNEPNIDLQYSSVMLFRPDTDDAESLILGSEGDQPYEELPSFHLISGHVLLNAEDFALNDNKNSSEGYSEANVLKTVIRNNIKTFEKYDTIYFDCNTFMSQVTENVMATADTFLAVTDAGYEGLDGVATFSQLWQKRADILGKEIDFDTVLVLNRFNASSKLHKNIYDILRGEFHSESDASRYADYYKNFIDCPIPETVKITEGARDAMPLVLRKDSAYKKAKLKFDELTQKLLDGGYLTWQE